MSTENLTFFEKVWNEHVIENLGGNDFLIHIDRHFLHELSGALSLKGIKSANQGVRNANLTFAVLDHVVDTFPGRDDNPAMPGGAAFIRELREGCNRYDIPLFDLEDGRQGIVHVVAPELGLALPGCTFACGDSHTCTVGGIGALGFGVGPSDGEVILASQCLTMLKPESMRVNFEGKVAQGVFAKDLILNLIRNISADGGSGYVVEFDGPVIRSMPIEGRLTLCNMAAEFSARSGLVSPDGITFEYLADKPYAPKGELWDAAVAHWTSLRSDPGAAFQKEVTIDCTDIVPQVTWGTSPEHTIGIDEQVPYPDSRHSDQVRKTMQKALQYTGLQPGQSIKGIKIDVAFIGSCTNSRYSDLEAAAAILEGRRVAPNVKAICSPGSTAVKRRAERDGIAKIFEEAGFEWRESGCSLCMSGSAGGETNPQGSRVISSTNRNFEHRQGRGVSSHLASPSTVAYSAIKGYIADVREVCG
ncbi:MAG: 3-isopropylmalate dehydratase large subunit [Pseudomonadales bacterium]